MEWEEIRNQIIIALGETIRAMIKRITIKSEEDWKRFSDAIEKIDKIKKEIEEL
ncbi:hypothetical protein ES707_22744 [subsurface metagenome]